MLMAAPVVFIHPRLTLKHPTWTDFLATCPSNAFQKVRAGDPPFTIAQRVNPSAPDLWCVYTSIYINVYTYIYMYICIFIHLFIYMYT
jgi:hypothetical protein